MIEDGIKSSKEKQTISDGRQSSMGAEIFHSRPQRQSQADQQRLIDYRKNFNSTPNVINRVIQTTSIKKHGPLATQINANADFGFAIPGSSIQVEKMIRQATN